MSHALARLRLRLDDPILTRAGRKMVMSPRAIRMRPGVRALVEESRAVLSPEHPFDPRKLDRSFVIHATDHVLTVLGMAVDRIARKEAPLVCLRFVPNLPDDATSLREGSADLAVGIYGDLPPEIRTKVLFTDRFVCVVRKDHPKIGRTLTLDAFAALEHEQIAPRGQTGGYLDDLLSERGMVRHVARAVPYFLAGLLLTANSDYVLTVSERLASMLAPLLGLRILEPPLPIKPYALSMIWHPRMDGDAAHQWLRDVLHRAAKESAGSVHLDARRRLTPKKKRPRAARR
jgi:DNA-binding transcriptional LysR family regulator